VGLGWEKKGGFLTNQPGAGGERVPMVQKDFEKPGGGGKRWAETDANKGPRIQCKKKRPPRGFVKGGHRRGGSWGGFGAPGGPPWGKGSRLKK